jgi:hypothetical protein
MASRARPSRNPRGTRSGNPNFRTRRLVVLVVVAALVALGANRVFGRADPVLGTADAPILLAWTSDDLLPELADASREAEGIGAVAEARNGVGWLTSWGAEGAPAETPPSGFQIPVEILAVDPEDYSQFIPRGDRSEFENLAEGAALLGETGAGFRSIESEGTLRLEGASIPVTGVVPDALVSNHEVVVSNSTAAALGIDDLRYVLLELERGTSTEEAEQELRSLLPRGSRLHLRGPADADTFRPGGTILSQAEIKKIFGEFAARPGRGRNIQIDPEWIEQNTANITIPRLGSSRCHTEVIPQIEDAFREVSERGLNSLIRQGDFGGCFAPRLLNSDPNSGISHHSWGIAFDFNVSRNPYGAEPNMDRRLVDLLEEWGFAWGGDWTVPDGMHFEYLREPDT